MSGSPDCVALYFRTKRIVRALLDDVAPGLILSIDIGGSFFDVVAENAAKDAGHRFYRFPSLLRYRSDLLERGRAARSEDVIGEAVIFGATDGTMRTTDSDEIMDSYSPEFESVATRSIDEWIAQRTSLRYVHFGDPDLALDQLEGASDTLARDRPALSFYPSGCDPHALLSRLERHGYRAMNLALCEPRPTTDTIADFGWLALPVEKRLDTIAGSGNRSDEREQDELLARASAAYVDVLPRHRLSLAVLDISPDTSPLVARTIAASDIVALRGCYPAESNGALSWRWLGPRPYARILVPCVLPGIYDVECMILRNRLPGGLDSIRVLVDGREVKTTVQGADPGTIRFVAHANARGYEGFLTIDLVCAGETSRIPGEPRTLRASVQAFHISPVR